MRPRGEIRAAVDAVISTAVPVAAPGQAVGVTWRDVAELACVGFDAARRTVDNIVAAGELIVVGHRRVPGVNRPMNVLARPGAAPATPEPSPFDALARCWADFR